MSQLIQFLLLLLLCSSCSPKPKAEKDSLPSQLPLQKNAILSNIETTGRISSNHFCDFVVDRRGNVYIATFKKINGPQDQPLIIKVAPSGEVVWKRGQGNLGRATGIAIDTSDQIRVVGYFYDQINLGDCSATTESATTFIATLDTGGNCLNLIVAEGGPTVFDISLNPKGEMLIGGVYEEPVTFGKTTLNRKGYGSFLAKFTSDGNCQWIRAIDANIRRIKNDSENNFYVTGSFYRQIQFGRDTLYTRGEWDADGFLLKLAPGKEGNWLKQFGRKGEVKHGFRSYECGSDIAIGHEQEVLLLAKIDKLSSPTLPGLKETTDLQLLRYRTDGTLLQSAIIAEQVDKSSIFQLAQDQKRHIWISGSDENQLSINNKKHHFNGTEQSFLIQTNPRFEVMEVVFPRHGPNMIFRSLASLGDQMILSGHYRSHLRIGRDSIFNNGQHGIFLFRTPIQ